MTRKDSFSSYHNEDGSDIHWPDPIRLPEPVADIILVRPRKGYVYVLDGKLLDDGTTRPTREPRVTPIMAAYLQYGAGRRMTLNDIIDATYHAGRHSRNYSFYSWQRDGADPEWMEEHTKKDHWVRCNTSDNFSCAARCHLKIILSDATITVTKPERGVYVINVEEPLPTTYSNHPRVSLGEFSAKYRAKFEREGIK